MLNTKTMTHLRPALSAQSDEGAPHKKALGAYLRTGDDDGLRGLELEGKALNTAVNAEGGYLVDPQTAEMIQGVLRGSSSLRAIANVVNVEATSFDVLVDTTDVGAGWASETAAAQKPTRRRSSASRSRCTSFRRCPRPASGCSTTPPSISRAGWRAASPTSSPAPRPMPSCRATGWTSPRVS